jgi:hypothetical protein
MVQSRRLLGTGIGTGAAAVGCGLWLWAAKLKHKTQKEMSQPLATAPIRRKNAGPSKKPKA